MASEYSETKSWRTSVFKNRESPKDTNRLEDVLSREQIRFLDDAGISQVYVIICEYLKPKKKNGIGNSGTIAEKIDGKSGVYAYEAIIYNYNEINSDRPEYRVEKISTSREEAINMAYEEFMSVVKSQMVENSKYKIQ